jgi:hypothetical protein
MNRLSQLKFGNYLMPDILLVYISALNGHYQAYVFIKLLRKLWRYT